MAVNMSEKMGEPTARIFMPCRSAGDLMAFLLLVSSPYPFSPQVSGVSTDQPPFVLTAAAVMS